MADGNSTFVGARDQDVYGREPYGVGVLDTYLNYKQEIERTLTLSRRELEGKSDYEPVFIDPKTINSNPVPPEGSSVIAEMEKDELHDGGRGEASLSRNTQFGIPDVCDSSLFGNDVINPYAGFCEDDDIHINDYEVKGVPHKYGVGRVYEEIYNSTQQIVYFQVGIPRYKNLGDFISGAVDENANKLAETGDVSVFEQMLSYVTKGAIIALKLPIYPIEWAGRLFNGDKRMYKVTDFFYFREEMLMYYRYVNSMLSTIAVNLGLYRLSWLGTDSTNNAEDDASLKACLPEIMKNGPDIFEIIQTRSVRFGDVERVSLDEAQSDWIKANKDALDEKKVADQKAKNSAGEPTDDTMGYFKALWEGAKSSALEGNKYLAFRIEKGQDNASENISNTTRDSSLASRLNGLVEEHRSRTVGAVGASTGIRAWTQQVFGKATAVVDKVKALFSSDASNFVENFNNLCDYGSVGTGYYDLPQEWGGANFTRSVSLNFRFRSKTGGDNVSIFTNIFVPLTCLMAMALPRATGKATYTSPFIVRCWCRGMFSIPAGYVTTMNITRGDSEYGWSRLRLPTVVNVSMSITDLSPILFIGMADNGKWFSGWSDIFVSNSKFHDYIATLTGLGIKQRLYYFTQLRKNAAAKILAAKNASWFTSPVYAGMRLGDTTIGRMIGNMAPITSMRVARRENY